MCLLVGRSMSACADNVRAATTEATLAGHSNEWYGSATLSPLTPAQLRVLRVLRVCSLRGDLPPTYRELQAELGFRSTATVRDHLKALERKGYVRLAARRFRGLQVLSSACPDLCERQVGVAQSPHDRSEAGAKWFAELLPGGGIAVLWCLSASCESDLCLQPGDRLMIDEGAAPTSSDWLAFSLDGESLARVIRNENAVANQGPAIRFGSNANLRSVGVVRAVIRRAVVQCQNAPLVPDEMVSRLVRGVKYAAC